jgi:uncharacterized membrane protein (UPF0127 family)
MAERPVFGPGPDTLLVDGRPVAPLSVARSSGERRRGLLRTSGVDGALWITKAPSVHMVGMRYPIDVAVVDRAGTVLLVATLQPWRGLTRPRRHASATIETTAGDLARWGVAVGSTLSIQPGAAGPTEPGPTA